MALESINVSADFMWQSVPQFSGSSVLEMTYYLKWSQFDEMAIPVGDH